jgi:thymidylate synthase
MRYFKNAQKAFEWYYKAIVNDGYGVPVQNTITLFNESFEIANPADHHISTSYRKWSLAYAHTEWLWYLSGDRSVAEIKKQAKIWDKMHNGNDLVWSNYGYWWKLNNQLSRVKNMLIEDPETRRAIVVHYDVNHIQDYKFDTPCNVFLNFYIQDSKLHLTVHARSIDLWYGFCNDQYQFSKLLMQTGDELNLEIGSLFFMITNFHLYKNKIKHENNTSH